MKHAVAMNASRRNRLRGIQRLNGRLHLAADLGLDATSLESTPVIVTQDTRPEVIFRTEVATTVDDSPIDEVFDRTDLSQVLDLAPSDGDWFEEALFIGPDFFDESLVVSSESSVSSTEFSYVDESESLFFVETHSTVELGAIGVTIDEVSVDVFAPSVSPSGLRAIGSGEGEFASDGSLVESVAANFDQPIASVDLVTFATEDLEISFSKITPLGETPQESVLVQLTPISENALAQIRFDATDSSGVDVGLPSGISPLRINASSESPGVPDALALVSATLVSATLPPPDLTPSTSASNVELELSSSEQPNRDGVREATTGNTSQPVFDRPNTDSEGSLFVAPLGINVRQEETESVRSMSGDPDKITLPMDQLGHAMIQRLFNPPNRQPESSIVFGPQGSSPLGSTFARGGAWGQSKLVGDTDDLREPSGFGRSSGIELPMILGTPVGRFDSLGAFDLFAEWSNEMDASDGHAVQAGLGWINFDDVTKSTIAQMGAAMLCVAFVGVARAAVIARRPKSDRTLSPARDFIFGSSTDLDETLRAFPVN